MQLQSKDLSVKRSWGAKPNQHIWLRNDQTKPSKHTIKQRNTTWSNDTPHQATKFPIKQQNITLRTSSALTCGDWMCVIGCLDLRNGVRKKNVQVSSTPLRTPKHPIKKNEEFDAQSNCATQILEIRMTRMTRKLNRIENTDGYVCHSGVFSNVAEAEHAHRH